MYDTKVVKKIFDEIGPRMRERPGGYTRITAIEPRKGDNAKMAAIELVDLVNAPATPRPQRVTAAPAGGPRNFQPLPSSAALAPSPVVDPVLAEAPASLGSLAEEAMTDADATDSTASVEAEAAEDVVDEAPDGESKEQS